MPRLFVAVVPPDHVLDAVAGLDRPAVAGLRWTSREQWHVTLRFLGHVADAGDVAEALAGVDLPAATAVLGPAVGRFGQRVLHVPVRGLDDIEAAVREATAHLGEPPEDRPFRGHLTLARVAKAAAVDLRDLAGVPVGGRWAAGGISLVESRLSPVGARYSVLATFAAGAGG